MGGHRHAPAALPPGKLRYALYRRLGGPQGRSGRVRKTSPPPGFDPRTVQPIASRYPGPIWQSNSPLYGQGPFDIWWNPNFHCRVQKSTLVILLFIWVSLVHHFTSVPSVSPLALPPVRVYVSRRSIQAACPPVLFFFTRVTVSYKVYTLLSWAGIAQSV